MNAIILVAGKEKKLFPLTEDMHQCLFKMSDKCTLLENMIQKIISLKRINQIIVVVGHKKELIIKELEEIKAKSSFEKIVYIENKEYMNTNVMYSLWLARDYLMEPFILIDGDIICEQELLEKLVDSTYANDNCLLVDYEYKLKEDENKVKIINNRIVTIGKKVRLSDESLYGRSVGIGKISSGNSALIKRMNELVAQNKKDLIYEDVLEELLPFYTFRPINTYGFNWMEVDSIDEFQSLNKIFSALEKLKEKALFLGATHVFPIDPQEIVFDSKAVLFCNLSSANFS